MTSNKKHNTIVICVAAVISVTILILAFAKNTNRHTYSYEVFQGTKGWGYNILVDSVITIHQERIPVLPTDEGFKKKEQAVKSAELMISKMKKDKTGLPFITAAEMEQICKE
ncbi:MAG: DUF4907 domain-containing protein [Chitinophagaceae bacterium]